MRGCILILFLGHSLSAASQVCDVELKAIRPTQFAVGAREVQIKAEKMGAMGARELEKYLAGHPVDVILGPGNLYYAIDGHHFALAAQAIGIRWVCVEIHNDYSDLSLSDFWKKMIRNERVYLYRLGEGPLSPTRLPKRWDQMIDDPYRSLASAVKREGGFKKSKDSFAEFEWAEFFRQYIKIEEGEEAFQKAVHAGYVLAQSSLAEQLPGHNGGEGTNCDFLLTGSQRKR